MKQQLHLWTTERHITWYNIILMGDHICLQCAQCILFQFISYRLWGVLLRV